MKALFFLWGGDDREGAASRAFPSTHFNRLFAHVTAAMPILNHARRLLARAPTFHRRSPVPSSTKQSLISIGIKRNRRERSPPPSASLEEKKKEKKNYIFMLYVGSCVCCVREMV